MNTSLQDRIEQYLDGVLDAEAARRFEQNLLDEALANEFREILLLREVLSDLPPDYAPEGLVERIESALALPAADLPEESQAAPGRRFGRLRAVVKVGWSWPGYALAGLWGGSGGMEGSVGGMQTIGYSLGPLREPARKGVQALRLRPKALWKTALSGVWRGLST
jgi:anti-sigma factor RsiW